MGYWIGNGPRDFKTSGQVCFISTYCHYFPIVTSFRVVFSGPKMISYNSTVFEGAFTACRLLNAFRSVNASVPFEIIAAKASTDSPTFPVEEYPKVSKDPFVNFRLTFL